MPIYVCAFQYWSIILCDVKNPTPISGNIDPVASTNISVGSNKISFIKSNVPIVAELFTYNLILLISPVAGSRFFISVNANDSECCVVTYDGLASYAIEKEDPSNFVYSCCCKLWENEKTKFSSSSIKSLFNTFCILDEYILFEDVICVGAGVGFSGVLTVKVDEILLL